MQLTHVIELFPTPVLFSSFSEDLTTIQREFFRTLPQTNNIGNMRSVDTHILNRSELSNVNTFIRESLQSYVDQVIQPKNPLDVVLTQSWVNWTQKGQMHHLHNHPNSFLSGVFYIATNNDSITFVQSERKLYTIPPVNKTNYNSDKCVFNPTNNDLIIFPSYLFHVVEVKQSEGERISLAFNATVKGTIGSEETLTELII